MIGRLIRLIAEAGIASLCCIINEESAATEEYLLSRAWPIPFQLVRKTTDNSMESLFTLAPLLEGAPFALFTVDAVFRALTLKRFLSAAAALPNARGVLALTRFCDDEKPLRVAMDRSRRVRRMGETKDIGDCVTAGFYRFEPSVFDFAETARKRGLSALRQFLCFLLEADYALYGISAAKTIDVDRPEDVLEAENYLKDHEGASNDGARYLREKTFSPGRVDDDAKIMDMTMADLASRGHSVCTLRGETLDGQAMKADCILSMAESKKSLEGLEERHGAARGSSTPSRRLETVCAAIFSGCFPKPAFRFRRARFSPSTRHTRLLFSGRQAILA